jgi:hypothetical protein
MTSRETADAGQQIEDLVGLEQFYEIEEATVEDRKWGKRQSGMTFLRSVIPL